MNIDENNFEQELSNALRRKEPAKGFAESVLRQVQPAQRRQSRWLPAAVAASLIAGLLGVARYDEHRRGEEAKQQLMLALRITAKTLDTVERKLSE